MLFKHGSQSENTCVSTHQTVRPCGSVKSNSRPNPYAIVCLPTLKGNCSLVRGGVNEYPTLGHVGLSKRRIKCVS